MRGSKAKRLRRESRQPSARPDNLNGMPYIVIDDQASDPSRPHPGRKNGGTVGRSAWSRQGNKMIVPKQVAELGAAMKKAMNKEEN